MDAFAEINFELCSHMNYLVNNTKYIPGCTSFSTVFELAVGHVAKCAIVVLRSSVVQ